MAATVVRQAMTRHRSCEWRELTERTLTAERHCIPIPECLRARDRHHRPEKGLQGNALSGTGNASQACSSSRAAQ